MSEECPARLPFQWSRTSMSWPPFVSPSNRLQAVPYYGVKGRLSKMRSSFQDRGALLERREGTPLERK